MSGYWPSSYWPDNYWPDNYWPGFGDETTAPVLDAPVTVLLAPQSAVLVESVPRWVVPSAMASAPDTEFVIRPHVRGTTSVTSWLITRLNADGKDAPMPLEYVEIIVSKLFDEANGVLRWTSEGTGIVLSSEPGKFVWTISHRDDIPPGNLEYRCIHVRNRGTANEAPEVVWDRMPFVSKR